ncbi:MAG: MaoC/PaaZ C-terminal domain-containing protein [Steroidobacteraceae bacterium]
MGEEIYVSDWISVSQEEINAFGRLTRDEDPMHMDPRYAREQGPFGSTIVFGFQLLSMLSHLSRPLRFAPVEGALGYDLNYGFNRVRFISPVPVDVPFRSHVVLKQIAERGPNQHLLTTTNTIEVRGRAKPALVAEWIGLMSRGPVRTPGP